MKCLKCNKPIKENKYDDSRYCQGHDAVGSPTGRLTQSSPALQNISITREDTQTYVIKRRFKNRDEVIVLARGVSLAEAKAHCSDPDTSSATCSTVEGQDLARQFGPWFDTWEEE